mmetsp:Transcript_12711/g.18481  ORF Transcript_12711/g.18481 Transcript_12711/m.18481 type:complete len:295 (-) Transcript_12711:21-905(-)
MNLRRKTLGGLILVLLHLLKSPCVLHTSAFSPHSCQPSHRVPLCTQIYTWSRCFMRSEDMADTTTGSTKENVWDYGECYKDDAMESLDLPSSFARRSYLTKGFAVTSVITLPGSAEAATSPEPKGKSRSEGYTVRKSPAEWREVLSIPQYNILRRGATERQSGSILNNETRDGTYCCAGCESALFASSTKFKSGTGWPSFEEAVSNSAVEIEDTSWLKASMDGVEVRCARCGGHLGDIFQDGRRYGSRTGKRFCINGSALVFRTISNNEEIKIRGDLPPPNKVIQYEPEMRRRS